jgi:hypothetical protein
MIDLKGGDWVVVIGHLPRKCKQCIRNKLQTFLSPNATCMCEYGALHCSNPFSFHQSHRSVGLHVRKISCFASMYRNVAA